MEESLKCECGNEHFWYFWGYVRCPHCFNEYKQTKEDKSFSDMDMTVVRIQTEYWLRRFNNETHSYDKNWEKVTSPLNIVE